MKYATPEAFRAGLDQRIRNEAAASGVSVMRLRKRVAFERFLARLTIVDPQRWVLKGAFALDLRLGLRTRTTKDIDLAGADDEQIATADLISAQTIALHDYFSFDVTRTPALDRAEVFRAVRYSVTAELAGRRFEQFPVDVALSEQPTAPSERLPIPSLLDFADIQPIEMPVIALEQHIAEKVHAYTATYGPQEQQSTRIKDLIDILLIAELATPDAHRLRDSLDATFRNRARQPLPSLLPAPPPRWTTPTPAPPKMWGSPSISASHTRTRRHSSTPYSPKLQPATGTQNNSIGPLPKNRCSLRFE
jgi:predicted nucleotidyltransferase component of viral defense system